MDVGSEDLAVAEGEVELLLWGEVLREEIGGVGVGLWDGCYSDICC